MNEYNFNQTRYLELLDEEESLKQRSTSLYWSDEEKYKELIHYSAQLDEHHNWKNKEKYFSVIIEFLNGKITGEVFTGKFLYVWRMLRDETLDDEIPTSESERFMKYINNQ